MWSAPGTSSGCTPSTTKVLTSSCANSRTWAWKRARREPRSFKRRLAMPDRQIEPCLLFVFGATGDLMHRKLLPALHGLASQGKLGDQYQILGVAQPKLDDRTYRQWACEALESARSEAGDSIGAWCAQRLHYHPSGDGSAEDLRGLAPEIDALEKQHGLPGNRPLYPALPPHAFPPVIAGLGQAGTRRRRRWARAGGGRRLGPDPAP